MKTFYFLALMMALRLNEPKLITEVIESIPTNDSKYLKLEFNKFF